MYEGLFDKAPKWLDSHIIFMGVSGSKAYGTDTPESDTDYRGVCTVPKDYILGFSKNFEQYENKDPDGVVFNLLKWVKLAADTNPNALELLFLDHKDILFAHPCWGELLDIREAFLSKRVYYTFCGYAKSQLKRMQTHRGYLMSPVKEPPSRKDFGLPDKPLIPKLDAADAAVQKLLDSIAGTWAIDKTEQLNIYDKAATALGFDTNFVELLYKEKQYSARMSEYHSYKRWETERNPKRREMELKFGYDCYDAETEFLTETGWKTFDQIKDDKLATIRLSGRKDIKWGTIEYQSFTHRFDSLYTGPMFNLVGNFVNTRVTANHNLLIQKEERVSRKQYDWQLEPAVHLPDCFNIMARCTPKKKSFKNPEEFKEVTSVTRTYLLKIMGWYLSDGCMNMRDGKPKCINISQRPDGKLIKDMKNFASRYGIKIYTYDRTPNSFNPNPSKESILSISNRDVIDFIYKYCGVTKEKRIPRFVLNSSPRYMEILFDAMRKGDGTIRKHQTKTDSIIYYSSLKGLADDVNELAVHCGWETSVYGPYQNPKPGYPDTMMYQVHVRKGVPQIKNHTRAQLVREEQVVNQRVVCFSVPNRTLVTRYKGDVSFHGNCKHSLHLVRLMRMCLELLENQQFLVKRPDAEELKAIRNGAWKYEDVMNWSKDQEAKIDAALKTTKLPDRPNLKLIEPKVIEIMERFL